MISIFISPIDREIAGLAGKFDALPGHIRRKHLAAAIGKAVKPFRSVMVKATPPGGVKRGRASKKLKKRSTGNLRRSVKVITKRGKNSAFAVMGYRGGFESRKAIWLEYGTDNGIKPRNIIRQVMTELTPKVKARLPAEMAAALEKAAAELASGKNPGGRRR